MGRTSITLIKCIDLGGYQITKDTTQLIPPQTYLQYEGFFHKASHLFINGYL
jgi:hypothetical protein